MGQPVAPTDPRGVPNTWRGLRVETTTSRDIRLALAAAAPPSVMEPAGNCRDNLLRVLADLLRPTATSIEIDGPALLRLDTQDAELIRRLMEQARARGLQLTGQGGLLHQMGSRVLESESCRGFTDHLGHDVRDPMDHDGGRSRPGSPPAVYPMIFVDAIHVKMRDGKGSDRPIYVALAVTAEGARDILGLVPGDDR